MDDSTTHRSNRTTDSEQVTTYAPGTDPDELARAEKKAAGRVPLGGYRWILLGGAFVFLLYLLSPHAGLVRGYDVLLETANAKAHSTNFFETFNAWVGLVGAVLCIIVAVTARRSVAQLAVLVCFVATVTVMIATWMRQVRSPEDRGSGPSFGLALDAFSMIVLFIALILLVIQRTKQQVELDATRRAYAPKSELGLAHEELLARRAAPQEDIFADHRREQARARIERTKRRYATDQPSQVNESGDHPKSSGQ